MITILGPTATGKTSFAVYLATQLNGEIISADSRQVYKGMDIGTGKDLQDYQTESRKIPYHLIDIVEPGYEYNVYEFQKDFLQAYKQIERNGTFPVLCGGTGMYIESVLKGYKLIDVPENFRIARKARTQI
jgi:tRNA dimethylallyltransferase